MRKWVWMWMLVGLITGLALPPVQRGPQAAGRVDAAVQRLVSTLPPGWGRLAVIIHLGGAADLAQSMTTAEQAVRPQILIEALQAQAARAQGPLLIELQAAQRSGEAGRVVPLWISNAVMVEASPALINRLAQRPDVTRISPDYDTANPLVPVDPDSAPLSAGPPEPNLGVIGATDLWAMGYTGQGVTVAVLDSGVDASHPDLVGRYRGGSNSWFDPYGQHATPADSLGHGTWVSGVILGDGTGNGTTSRSTGVAPGAQWIAAKIFPDPPVSQSLTAVHLAFQWVLDPDGNPATPDAPQVVNNSWDFNNPGCSLEFQPDLLALRAAGITPVFAAGNNGPGAGANPSPANNRGALAVGAVDNLGGILSLSARGPNFCDASQIFPGVMAPGSGVFTTDRGGGYVQESGTSLAAPHVSGGLALLLSAYPYLSPALQEKLVLRGAVDLGPAGPDNAFGYGLLHLPNSLAALRFTYLPYARMPLVYWTYLPVAMSH